MPKTNHIIVDIVEETTQWGFHQQTWSFNYLQWFRWISRQQTDRLTWREWELHRETRHHNWNFHHQLSQPDSCSLGQILDIKKRINGETMGISPSIWREINHQQRENHRQKREHKGPGTNQPPVVGAIKKKQTTQDLTKIAGSWKIWNW